jgi:hypothetical protein
MSGYIIFKIRPGLRLKYQTQIFSTEGYVTLPVSTERRFMFMEVINNNSGMKNAETTLDSLSILCLDGKTDDIEDGKLY